jgi:Flp pilus assembly protein CpaB
MATRRRGRALIFVAVILILVLVVVLAGWTLFIQPMMAPPPVQATPEPEFTSTPVEVTVDIVMTTQLVPRGGTITENVVALVPIPRRDVMEGSTFFIGEEGLGEVIGQRARIDLRPNTPLTNAVMVGEDGNVASFEIPRGMVAISIPISKLSSVSYGLVPGDHVNVITSLLLIDIDPNFQSRLPNNTSSVTLPGRLADQFTGVAVIDSGTAGRGEFDPTLGTPIYVIPSEGQRPRLVSQTLIQDTIVLQMGIFAQGAPQPQAGITPAPADPNAPPEQAQPTAVPVIPVPDVITLIVSPQDAVTLNYLMLAGARINLVMRAAGDTDTVQTEAVTLQFVMDQYGIPNPAKLPYGIEPRTDSFVTNNMVLPFPDAGTPVPSLLQPTPVP